MQTILKNSTYIHERTIKNQQSRENSKLESYWSKFFLHDKDLLATSIKSMSNLPLENLSEYYDTNYSFVLDDDLLKLERLYFNNLKGTRYLKEDFKEEIKESVPFYTFFLPFLELGLLELHTKGITNQISFERALSSLIESLFQISNKTLILEINVKRVLSNKNEITPEERYNLFLHDFLTNKQYLEEFYHEYPVLFRLLLQTVSNWVKYISEIIENTTKDKIKLNSIYNNNDDLGEIKGINLSLGDSHNGKSVALIEFESGMEILYKPRSLLIDKQYNELIKFFNSQKATKYNFFEIKVLDRGKYGWMTFIEHLACNTDIQVKNFYVRSGNLLALMYILNATDFHHENIIAHSEYPVPIDLETLTHQHFLDLNDDVHSETAIQKAANLIKKSVKSTGMLPNQIFLEKGEKKSVGIDVSGMGAKGDQKSSHKVQKIINLNSDLIRISKDFLNIRAEKNNPYILGQDIKNSDYIEEIKSGFQEMYRWVMKNKGLMKTQLKKFGNLETRVILRATNQYSRLLDQSFHPDFLRNGIARDLFLHRINVNKPSQRDIDKVIKKEKKDLLNGDIPTFSTKLDEPHLYIDETTKIENYFKLSNKELVNLKLDSLSKDDLLLQLSIIHMSVLAGDSQPDKDSIKIKLEEKSDSTVIKERCLNQAVVIGERILSRAIRGRINHNIDYSWISTVFNGTEESSWSISPTGVDLYNGNAGVAIFFSYLSKLTNRKDFKEASYNSLNSMRERLKNFDSHNFRHMGAFDGWAGCIYSMHIVAENWDDSILREEVANGVDIINLSIDHIQETDITSGLAGLLGILLSIYETTGYEKALKVAEKCAIKIINKSVTMGKGIAWNFSLDNMAYTGFAHGSAGILSMLARLYTFNKDPLIINIIKKALNFERNNYVSAQGNWKRSFTDNTLQYAWCHGAPGILLSRLILKDIGYKDDLIDKEIQIAINTTLERGLTSNHSLCHGNFGQIEILKMASKLTCDTILNNKINCIIEYVLHDIENKGIDELKLRGMQTQGLMNGLSGYGYGLLAQSTDIPLPSILMLGPINHL